jgi:hypothetical protein
MDIKRVLWVIFSFVLVGMIASAVIGMAGVQINRAKSQQPDFPDTPSISLPN